MKDYPNIEKRAFRRGEYVGYAKGAWRITKSTNSDGNWFAVHQRFRQFTIHAWTLEMMSKRLIEMESQVIE